MFVTDKLVFLQLRKTGCGHIARLLSDYVGGRQIGVHNRITPDLTPRFVVGSVRNPWDWYVSVWAFGFGEKKTGVERPLLTSRPKSLRWLASRAYRSISPTETTPSDTVREFIDSYRRPYREWQSTYTEPTDVDAFRRWLRMALEPRRARDLGEGYGYSSIHRFAGLLTYRYLWLFSRDKGAVLDARRFDDLPDLKVFDAEQNLLDFVIRTENLEENFLRALELAGHEASEELRAVLDRKKQPKTNRSKHLSTAFYYDAETQALVAEKERFIIDKYGYAFPASPETSLAIEPQWTSARQASAGSIEE